MLVCGLTQDWQFMVCDLLVFFCIGTSTLEAVIVNFKSVPSFYSRFSLGECLTREILRLFR